MSPACKTGVRHPPTVPEVPLMGLRDHPHDSSAPKVQNAEHIPVMPPVFPVKLRQNPPPHGFVAALGSHSLPMGTGMT
jgi:hypothetical protein